MGIIGLPNEMKNARRLVDIRELAGQKAAIDISTWMYLNYTASATAQSIYRRLLILRQCGVEPVVVFDGVDLPAKGGIVKKRSERRRKFRDKADTLMKQGDKKEAIKLYRRCAIKRTPLVVGSIKKFCRSYGFEYWQAPYESDAQIAYLMRKGVVDFVITSDSDFIPYNCEKILYDLVFKDNGATGNLYEQSKFKDCWGKIFNEDCLLAVCIVKGCDYFPAGLFNFGIKKVPDLYCKLGRPFYYDNMVSLLSQMGYEVDNAFEENFYKAYFTFKHQLVHGLDGSTVPLQPYDDGMSAANYDFAGDPGVKGEHWFLEDKSSVPAFPAISLNESFYCNKCRNYFASRDDLSLHHQKDHRIQCSFCNKAFGTKYDLTCHMKLHQKINARKRAFKCVTCGKVCKSAVNLRLHEKSKHSKSMPSECLHACNKCEKRFSSLFYLYHHNRAHKEVLPFQCTKCDAGFTLQESLEMHMRIHNEDALVECGKCGQAYRRLNDLTLHAKTCNGKPGVKCPVCPQGFNEYSSMRVHVRDLHPGHVWQPKMSDGPHKCPVCFQGFTEKNKMRNHLKKFHSDYVEPPELKPFKCPQCDSEFTREPNMRRHFKQYHPDYALPPPSGLKPYKCPVPECDNAYVDPTGLAGHIAIEHPGQNQTPYTKPKAYPCPVDGCLKGYAKKEKLKAHLSKKHPKYTPPAPVDMRERPWICDVCQKDFYTRENRDSHRRKVHGLRKASTSKD